MAERAALITGGSSGIGLAIASALGREGYGVTIAARRPDKLEAAAETLRDEGLDVHSPVVDMTDEESIVAMVASHRERFGRCDVLVNNAGVGIGSAVEETPTKRLDMQLDVNLRGVIITTREAVGMLREAGAEHGKALMVNTASIAGKSGQPWLSVYSATKFAVVGWSQAMHKELSPSGVQVTALCPGFVDTPMTDFVKEQVSAEEMIQPDDIAQAVVLLLKTSRACIIPEIQFIRPGDGL